MQQFTVCFKLKWKFSFLFLCKQTVRERRLFFPENYIENYAMYFFSWDSLKLITHLAKKSQIPLRAVIQKNHTAQQIVTWVCK